MMVIHTQLNLDDIAMIGRAYSLLIDEFQPVKDGLRNSNYLIKSAGKKFILRVCDDQTEDQAETLVDLLEYLSLYDFPCPKPVLSKEAVVTKCYDKPVLVFKYLEGESVRDLNSNQLQQLGKCMAALHSIPPPDFLPRSHPFGFERYKSRFATVDHPYIPWFEERTAYFNRMIPPNIPNGIVHGDLFFDNALYREEKLVGIIDFESAFYGPTLFDLGMASIGACRDNGVINLRKMRSLVKGYELVRPLLHEEKGLLKICASYAAAVISIWRFDYFNIRNNDPENNRYREAVDLSDCIAALPNDSFINDVFGNS